MISIKKKIKESNISLRKLGGIMSVCPSALSDLMCNKKVSYAVAEAIAYYFKVDMNECEEFEGIKKTGKYVSIVDKIKNKKHIDKNIKCDRSKCLLNKCTGYCQSPIVIAGIDGCMRLGTC